MNGILVYSKDGTKANTFAINKFKENLGVRLVLKSDVNFNESPPFVINRTNDFKIAEGFEKKGIRVFNPRLLTEIANNKQKTYDFMERHNIEILPTRYTGVPAVKKANAGHGGTEVFMITEPEEFEEGFVYQKPATDLGQDLRVWLINGKIITAVLRKSNTDFRANFSLGGTAEVYTLSDSEKELTLKIAALLPHDFIGIDFVFNNGKIVFNEIEDSVGSRTVYEKTNIDIIKLYCDYIKSEI